MLPAVAQPDDGLKMVRLSAELVSRSRFESVESPSRPLDADGALVVYWKQGNLGVIPLLLRS